MNNIRVGYLFRNLVQVFPFALALDGHIGHILAIAVKFGRHAQGSSRDSRLAGAAGETDGHAGAAAYHQHLLSLADKGFDLIKCFLFGNNHRLISFLGASLIINLQAAQRVWAQFNYSF